MSNEASTLSNLNQLSESDFVSELESLYEHSPWVVSKAAGLRPFPTLKSMQVAFERILYEADSEIQLQLIAAHPDLAVKLDQIIELTEFSEAEQKRAGFSTLPIKELDALREALEIYRNRFNHPFILCVSEHSAKEVLPILNVRCQASLDAERIACLAQIARIGWHRLTQLVASSEY